MTDHGSVTGNVPVACGQVASWPYEDYVCTLKAGHYEGHLYEEDMPVLVTIAGQGAYKSLTEQFKGHDFTVIIDNGDERVKVSIDKDRAVVEVTTTA